MKTKKTGSSDSPLPFDEFEIPEGWEPKRFHDGLIIDVQTGFACGKNTRDGKGIPHLRPMNVTEKGQIDLNDLKFVPESECSKPERFVNNGDVIFNNTNSPALVGKTAYYNLPEPRAFSNHMTRLRCNKDIIDPVFCAMILHQKWREGYFKSVCNNHVSQSSISRQVLLDTPILLPPLAEQQSIVAHVEALLVHVNATRDRLNRVPLIMKRFRQAVLAAACSGRLTDEWREGQQYLPDMNVILNEIRHQMKSTKKRDTQKSFDEISSDLPELPDKWGHAFLNEVVSDSKNAIKRGPFGSSIKKEYFVPNGFKIYEQKNVIYNDFKIGRYYINKEKFHEMKDFELKPEDVVISCSGTIGKIAIVPQNIESGIINQALLKITFNNNLIMSQYYVDLFHTDYYQKTISASARGSAMQNISSVSEIKQIPIPLPPLAEQHEIVLSVNTLFAQADEIDREVAAAKKRAEAITQAVLGKAFRGELVTHETEA
jgi:type I restriction enzyme, S subunit